MEAHTSVTNSIYKSWTCFHGLKWGCWPRHWLPDSRFCPAGPGRESRVLALEAERGQAFSLAPTGRGSWEVRVTLPLLPLPYQGGTENLQDFRGCPEGRAEQGLCPSGVTETHLRLVKQPGKPGRRKEITGKSVGSKRNYLLR